MKRLFLFSWIIMYQVSCGGPEVDPIPSSTSPGSNPSINTPSSNENEREKRRIIVDFDLSFQLVNENTGNPVSGAIVYYDVFFNRFHEPYKDAYLISNNIPGQLSVRTSSFGIGKIKFDTNVSDDAQDELAFTLQLYGEIEEFEKFNSITDLFVLNNQSLDTLRLSSDTIKIEVKTL